MRLTSLKFTIVALLLASLATGAGSATKIARPLSTEQLAGSWVGFREDGLALYRLELKSDGTGVLASSWPGESVYVSLVKWNTDGYELHASLAPLRADDNHAFLHGRASSFRLDLEVGSPGKWKMKLWLHPEHVLNETLKQTADAIKAVPSG